MDSSGKGDSDMAPALSAAAPDTPMACLCLLEAFRDLGLSLTQTQPLNAPCPCLVRSSLCFLLDFSPLCLARHRGIDLVLTPR